MNRAKMAAVGILIFIFIIVLLQNTQDFTINVLFWEFNTSAYSVPIIMVLCAGLGYFIASFLGKRKQKRDDDYI